MSTTTADTVALTAEEAAAARALLCDATLTWSELALARATLTGGDCDRVLAWQQIRLEVAGDILGDLDTWAHSADARTVLEVAGDGTPAERDQVLREVYTGLCLAPATVHSDTELRDLAAEVLREIRTPTGD